MSTEPGENKGGPPGAAGAGSGGTGKKTGTGSGSSSSSKSGTKPSKTVAAASAKSGARDETSVDLDTSDADGKPGSPSSSGSSGKSGSSDAAGTDTTRMDLAKIEDKSAKDSGSSEIAPVKDTAGDSSDLPAKSPAPYSSSSSPSSSPSSSSGSAGWATPAEPSGSVSAGRTESARKPFTRSSGNSSSAAAGNSAAASSSPSGGSGRGFAGTVLKDRPSTAVAPAGSAKPTNGKPARKAQLQLSRLEPWSVMKFSFVMSLVCFVVLLVAVIVLYAILSGLGVFDAISDTINSLTKEQGETTGSVDAGSWFSFFRIFGYTVLVGALNVMLITALSTVGSVIYNLAADLVGGVEVTLKEAE